MTAISAVSALPQAAAYSDIPPWKIPSTWEGQFCFSSRVNKQGQCSHILLNALYKDRFLFIGIHPDASRWLVKNRKVKMVGIDTPSMDFGQSKMFQTHQILYAENIPGLENVAHMDKLPTKCFTVYAAPMFISGGSGGPCRVFARLDENCSTNAVVRFQNCSTSAVVRLQNDIVFLVVMICLVFGFLWLCGPKYISGSYNNVLYLKRNTDNSPLFHIAQIKKK